MCEWCKLTLIFILNFQVLIQLECPWIRQRIAASQTSNLAGIGDQFLQSLHPLIDLIPSFLEVIIVQMDLVK